MIRSIFLGLALAAGTPLAAQQATPSVPAQGQTALEARADQVVALLNGEVQPEAIFTDGFRAAIMELRKTLNIPENLTALGVTNPNLDELTEMALEDPSCGGNPVAMTRENTLALFKSCL